MWLGIDFGTCNSSAAVMLNGVLKPIKEPLKHSFSFPSSVFLTEQKEMLVGQAAVNSRRKDPQRYKEQFKRDLGSYDPYRLGDLQLMPQDLVMHVIRKLKTEADRMVMSLGQPQLTQVTLTVPATYQKYKRNLMQETGIAAAIYYAHHHQQLADGEIILVYDLGGGTFDATLIKKVSSGYQLLTMPKGLSHCGGTDFDREIYQTLKSNCSSTLRQQLEDKGAWLARAIVSDLCRDLKHQLSEEQEAVIYVPLGLGDVEPCSLNRQAFNSLISSLIDKTVECCDELIRNANIQWQDINHTLLVGGSCRIPYIKEALARKVTKPPLLVDEPELSVCLGAAIYGERLNVVDTVSAEPIVIQPVHRETQEPKQEPQQWENQKQDEKKEENKTQLVLPAIKYYHQGLERSLEKNFWRAIEEFNLALRMDSDYADAYYQRGICRFQLGDYGGGIEDLQKAANLFFQQEKLTDYQKALKTIQDLNARKSVPSQDQNQLDIDKLYQQGIEKIKQKDYHAAVTDFDLFLKHKSNYANAYFYRSFAYFCLSEYSKAINDCEQSIRIDPNFASAYVCRAYTQISLEQYKNAVQDCNQALKINPQHGGAYLGLAVVRASLGVTKKALEDFNQLRRIVSQSNINYYNQILANAVRGEKLTVIKDLQEAGKLLFPEFDKR
jgi:tetratricopeptide (TPR) repeat protein